MEIVSKDYEKLMEYIYDKYKNNEVNRGYGEFASVYVDEFCRETGIRFGDVYAQMAAINYLYKQGWIEILRGKNLTVYHSYIIPSNKGIKYIEEKRSIGNKMIKIVCNLSEVAGRFIKGIFGK